MPLALRVFASPKAMAWITDYTIPWETPATVASA
jgi:hypothetical protein